MNTTDTVTYIPWYSRVALRAAIYGQSI